MIDAVIDGVTAAVTDAMTDAVTVAVTDAVTDVVPSRSGWRRDRRSAPPCRGAAAILAGDSERPAVPRKVVSSLRLAAAFT